MPTPKYTSFQIKNTAEMPMEISLTDPDGEAYKVELGPGEQSIQVAPTGTIWGVTFGSSEAPKPGIDAPKPGIDAPKPGIDAPTPRIDAPKPGIDAPKPGIDAAY